MTEWFLHCPKSSQFMLFFSIPFIHFFLDTFYTEKMLIVAQVYLRGTVYQTTALPGKHWNGSTWSDQPCLRDADACRLARGHPPPALQHLQAAKAISAEDPGRIQFVSFRLIFRLSAVFPWSTSYFVFPVVFLCTIETLKSKFFLFEWLSSFGYLSFLCAELRFSNLNSFIF